MKTTSPAKLFTCHVVTNVLLPIEVNPRTKFQDLRRALLDHFFSILADEATRLKLARPFSTPIVPIDILPGLASSVCHPDGHTVSLPAQYIFAHVGGPGGDESESVHSLFSQALLLREIVLPHGATFLTHVIDRPQPYVTMEVSPQVDAVDFLIKRLFLDEQ